MCLPPDLTPVAAAGPDDGFVVEEDWGNEGPGDAAEFEGGNDISPASLLGKRELGEDAASIAAKLPRTGAHVSSAFDSAAASFMARMEQSMFQDLQRQQQLRRPAAPAVEADESLLLQCAILEQRNKQLQQLQQLRLLKQLQQQKQAEALAAAASQVQVLPGQQRLLLAQQQLLQQSQHKQQLLDALAPATIPAAPQAAAWASLVQQQQAATPAAPAWKAERLSAESKLQALMQGAAPTKTLPLIQPKPAANPTAAAAAAILAAAKAGTELSPAAAAAAAMLGLGPLAAGQGHPGAGVAIGEERKAKRMQSNRASAKRSRQRRQARLEELDKSTAQLQEENSTMCTKLEQAQQEIVALEEKNRSLVGEVLQLRKMLGLETASLEAAAAAPKAKFESTTSGAGQPQSCVESEGCGTVVKGEQESNGGFELDNEEGEENQGQDDNGFDWLGSLPLSPGAASPLRASSPGLDQLALPVDSFSELLACLDG